MTGVFNSDGDLWINIEVLHDSSLPENSLVSRQSPNRSPDGMVFIAPCSRST